MRLRLLILIALLAPWSAAVDEPSTVVFLGDSLTAGYGLDAEEAYPALIQERLAADGLPWQVINAGRSGDTSKGALARLDWLLRADPDLVVVAIGANDGLRGLPVEGLEANLRAIIARIREHGAEVLLSGMTLPRNLGPDYIAAFDAVFPRVAQEFDIAYDPFLLAGVAAVPELNQADRIHPNAEGHEVIAGRLYPVLRRLVAADAEASETAE